MAELLNNYLLDQVEENLANFDKEMKEYIKSVQDIIDSFHKDDIFYILYKSGKFGKKEEDKIIRVCKGLAKYREILCENGGLVDQTKKFVDHQRALNNKGGN